MSIIERAKALPTKVKIAGGVVGGLILIGSVSQGGNAAPAPIAAPSIPTTSTTSTAAAKTAEQAAARTTPAAPAASKAAAVPSPAKAADNPAVAALKKDFGDRLLTADLDPKAPTVVLKMRDEVTEDLARTAAQHDTITVIKDVQGRLGGSALYLEIQGVLTDAYGKSSTEDVVAATYEAPTLAKIHPDSIDPIKVWKVADSIVVNPALGQD